MLKCAEDQCPTVLEDKSTQEMIRTSCREKSSLPVDFTRSLVLDSMRTDVLNKVRSVGFTYFTFL